MVTLSNSCMEIVNAFVGIPYFRHRGKSFGKKSYLIGKGRLTEIKTHLGTGIDCSGFVCRVIEAEKPIKQVIYPTGSWFARLRFWWRPVENTNVALLASAVNSRKVPFVGVRPGDLICVGVEHVMMVVKVVGKNIYYAHASEEQKQVVVQKWGEGYYYQKYKKNSASKLVRLLRWPK